MVSSDSNTQTKERNPYTPWFVVIAFAGPVIAAYALYFLGVSPPSFSNHGDLINPVIDVTEMQFSGNNNEALSLDDITMHKWHMLYFASADCDSACKEVLHKIRQVNIAAGKNAYRLQRMIVHLERPSNDFEALINDQYPKAVRVNANSKVVNKALERANLERIENEVYIMDPLGNIMMRYKADQPPRGILNDLNKLFKVSQIG